MQKIPQPIGPYSNTRESNGLLFLSGQLPVDPKTGKIVNDFKDACRRSLNNIKEILAEEKLSMDSVIKLTVLTTELNKFEIINDVFEEFFEDTYPARSAYEVSKLPKNAVIEIEAIVTREKQEK